LQSPFYAVTFAVTPVFKHPENKSYCQFQRSYCKLAIQLLSDTTVKTAKPGDKTTRLNDGGGLYLEL